VRELVFITDVRGKSIRPGRSAGVSLAVHAAAILLAILVGTPVTRFIAQPRSLVLIAPSPAPVPRTLPLRVLPTHAARLAVLPPQTPKLTLPVIEIPAAPVVEPVRAALPTPDLARVIVPLTPPVKTGEFAQAIPETRKPVPQPSLQAAGFAAAENSPSPLPRGQLKASSSGFDNAGTTNQGPRHTGVSASGFSDGAPAAVAPAARQPIAKSSFGDAATQAPASVAHAPIAVSLTSPVDILSKPRPVYSAEARTMGIEGEVLVEVVFEAGGSVRVVRLVKGLGHGLDENAVAAAREIRFRPARREGIASDASAVVHILFQLAY
jgi:TonB family protein